MDIFEQAKEIARETSKKYDRKEAIKAAVRRKVEGAVTWMNENTELVSILVPVCVYGARSFVGMTKTAIRTANLHKERDLKELYCYDRSLGHYWALRRKLTNREWVEIDRRKRSGEKLGDILKELKVLK